MVGSYAAIVTPDNAGAAGAIVTSKLSGSVTVQMFTPGSNTALDTDYNVIVMGTQ